MVISTANGIETVEYRDTVTSVVTSRGLEPAAGSAQANAITLVGRAQGALTQNATYLAVVTPSVAQVTAQVDRLTRECSAVIRMLLARSDSLADS